MNKLILLLLLILSLACSAPVALTVTATPAPAFGLAVRPAPDALRGFVAPTATPANLAGAITVQIEDPAGVVYIEPNCVWMLAIGDVNIRAAPSAEAAILHTLLEGQGACVISIADGWAQTRRGYIKAEWLK